LCSFSFTYFREFAFTNLCHTSFISSYVHPYEEELKVWNPTESQLSLQSTPQILSEIHPDEVFELLSTPGEVDEMMQCLLKATEIGVDLEHHSVRSFMGLTCLIQISTRTQDFIIDGLAMHRNLESLNQVFTNPQIIKVNGKLLLTKERWTCVRKHGKLTFYKI